MKTELDACLSLFPQTSMTNTSFTQLSSVFSSPQWFWFCLCLPRAGINRHLPPHSTCCHLQQGYLRQKESEWAYYRMSVFQVFPFRNLRSCYNKPILALNIQSFCLSFSNVGIAYMCATTPAFIQNLLRFYMIHVLVILSRSQRNTLLNVAEIVSTFSVSFMTHCYLTSF